MQIRGNYEYHIPSDLNEAKELILQGATIMAGGSDVMPQLKMDTIHPDHIVDLARISSLKGVSICTLATKEEADATMKAGDQVATADAGIIEGLRIGAMTTLDKLSKNPLILQHAPIISRAARNVASPQIRNRGTIGGNLLQARRCFYYNQTKEWRDGIPVCKKVGGDICLQIPKSATCRAIYYSDMAPALVACDALILVEDAKGEQLIPIAEFITAHCEDRLAPCLIKEILVPAKSYQGPAATFAKYSLRGSIDFPIVNFACAIHADGVIRFTAGAIATNVLRLESVEQYLMEAGSDFDTVKASELAEEEMKKKCQLIRESGLSVRVKRLSFKQVHEILEQVSKDWKASERR